MSPWLYLAIAIALEVAGTTCMKLSEGFTKPVPSVLLFVFYLASFAVFTLALEKIPLSISYAIWAGLGTAIVAVIGVVVFNESASALKAISVALIIAGVVGLNLSKQDPEDAPSLTQEATEL